MKHSQVEAEAARLQRRINDHIATHWRQWSRLAYLSMIEQIARDELGGLWEYMVAESLGGPPAVAITRYTGPVEEG